MGVRALRRGIVQGRLESGRLGTISGVATTLSFVYRADEELDGDRLQGWGLKC